MCPYSEFSWSAFSRIGTEYEEIRSISPYSVQMRKNMGQKNSEYRQFLRSVSKERSWLVNTPDSLKSQKLFLFYECHELLYRAA